MTTKRTARTPDGLRLHIEETGRGKRAMLLCNGLYCSTHYYGPWIEQFAADHRVVAFDYRGHGESADPADPSSVTLTTLVSDAATVLATISEPVILVGHSMGVRVALELAARAGNKVDAVVLLCGTVWGIGDPRVSLVASRVAPPLLALAGRAHAVSRVVRDTVVHPEWMIRVGSLFGGLARSTPRAPIVALAENLRRLDVRMMASIASSYVTHSARELLPRVQAPTLQIIGAHDQLATLAHAREVERELARCSTFVVDDCTHLAPIEAPEVVHRAVRGFLAPLAERSAAAS